MEPAVLVLLAQITNDTRHDRMSAKERPASKKKSTSDLVDEQSKETLDGWRDLHEQSSRGAELEPSERGQHVCRCRVQDRSDPVRSMTRFRCEEAVAEDDPDEDDRGHDAEQGSEREQVEREERRRKDAEW